MSLEAITGGETLEMIIFWSIGAFVLGIGVIDTWWKRKLTIKDGIKKEEN